MFPATLACPAPDGRADPAVAVTSLGAHPGEHPGEHHGEGPGEHHAEHPGRRVARQAGGLRDAVRLPVLDGRAGGRRSGSRSAWGPSAVVVLLGLLVTVAASGASVVIDRRNDHSLLEVQTRQAASVIGATVLQISQPLTSAAEIARVTGGNATAFEESLGARTGAQGVFVSGVLLEVRGEQARRVAAVGVAPLEDPAAPASGGLVRQALAASTFVVRGVGEGGVGRVAYAYATKGDPRYVVYAERAIPANRRVPVESDSAFADLHFATYIGREETAAALATTDQDPATLPLTGDTARATIPFGNTVITMVTTAGRPLGGSLGRLLPWIFLAGGLVLTAMTATWTSQMIRRRALAEQDAATIQTLYARLDGLYAEQRGIAETLQRALLPQANPPLPGLQTAVRYVAGARGVDVGGDWYGVVPLDEEHAAFVVGDVSGRGVSAATLMARLRFTIRAYLMEGHGPDAVLEMCASQIDIEEDGHFATVLVGVVDIPARRVTLANAGHPEPLLISGGRAVYAATAVGPPLGTWPARYATTTVTLEAGSTLLAFTDGLIERRDESLDAGLERLAGAAVTAAGRGGLEAAVDGVLELMLQQTSEDDIAVLALAWP